MKIIVKNFEQFAVSGCELGCGFLPVKSLDRTRQDAHIAWWLFDNRRLDHLGPFSQKRALEGSLGPRLSHFQAPVIAAAD